MAEFFTRFNSVFFERTRLSILSILYRNGTSSFNQFKAMLEGTDGTLYAHLEKLVKEGYITKQKEVAGMSVQTVYSLTGQGKSALSDYLAFMEDMILAHRGGGK